MGTKQKFAYDVGMTFVANVAQAALAFVVTVVLGRLVGASDLGLYRVTLTIYGLTVLFAGIGIPSAIIKYAAQYKDNKDRINEITTSGIISVFLSSIVFLVLFYALSGIISSIFKMPELRELLKILSFIFPFALINSTMLGVLNGYRDMKKYALAIAARSSLMVAIASILVYFKFGAKGAVIGLILSEVLVCLLLVWFTKPYFKLKFRNILTSTASLTKFGVQILGADAINTLNKQLDIILIGLFLLPSDVGYYAAAVSMSRFFWLIPSSIQRITYPATSEYWERQNHAALNSMINRSIKYTSIILVSVGLGVFFFGNFIITFLFKRDFSVSFIPLQILLFGTIIRGCIAQPIGASLTAIGRPDLVLKLTLFMLLINGLLDLLLIPRIGIIGAAIATSVSLSLGAFLNLILMVKHMSLKIDNAWLLKLLSITTASLALFKLGTYFINPVLLGFLLLFGTMFVMITLLLTRKDFVLLKSLPTLLLFHK